MQCIHLSVAHETCQHSETFGFQPTCSSSSIICLDHRRKIGINLLMLGCLLFDIQQYQQMLVIDSGLQLFQDISFSHELPSIKMYRTTNKNRKNMVLKKTGNRQSASDRSIL